jgi:hypothetical protein
MTANVASTPFYMSVDLLGAGAVISTRKMRSTSLDLAAPWR